MADATYELEVNVTTTNVWTQLLQQGGAAYTVPIGRTADVRWLTAISLGANIATAEFALSSGSSVADVSRACAPIPLTQYETLKDSDGHALKDGYGVWARAVGTSPNVTFRAYILENS